MRKMFIYNIQKSLKPFDQLIIYPACILTALFLLAPKAHSRAEEEFHQTCTVDAGTEVMVKNINGNVHISTWENNYVDIHALKTTKRGRDELDRVKIEVETNGILRIETVKNNSYEEDSFFKIPNLPKSPIPVISKVFFG